MCLRIHLHSLKHFGDALVPADSEALVEALIDALVDALNDALVLYGSLAPC